jgi:transcription antitermination factor NusG
MVKPRHEKVVARSLESKGYVEFLPLVTRHHRSGGRIQTADVPLFPGYVFCSFDPSNRLPVLTTPGVYQIVGTSQGITPVDRTEIESIRAMIGAGMQPEPCTYLNIGDVVTLSRGPIRGVTGTLENLRGRDRLIVSITLLQRSVSVEVDRAWVEASYSSVNSS